MENKINQIADLINRRELVLFVGAGISLARPSNLLRFCDLQNEIIWALCQDLPGELKKTYEGVYKEIEGRNINSEIAERFMSIPPEYIFEICKKGIICENNYSDYYELKTLEAFRYAEPNQNHLFLEQLLVGEYVPAILTTNFDLLIERAIERVKRNTKINKYWKREQFEKIRKSQGNYYKLHGCINDLDSIVVSLDDVGKRCTSQLKSFKYFLENYFVFFGGYRGVDLDIFSHLVSTQCKGIIWNDLSKEAIIPKVKKMLEKQKGITITGDISEIFSRISLKLKLDEFKLEINHKEKRKDFSKEFGKWAEDIDSCSKIAIMGDLWEYISEWEVAVKFFDYGHKVAKASNNKFGENVFLNRLAGLYFVRGKFKEAKNICNRLLDNSKNFPKELKLYEYMNTFQLLGLIEAKKDIKKAMDFYIQSLRYQEELEKKDHKIKHRKSEILLNIGNIFHKYRFMEEAIKHYKSAIVICDEFGDVKGRANGLASIGNVLFDTGKYDDCIFYYREAEYLFNETGSISNLSKIYFNLALVYCDINT